MQQRAERREDHRRRSTSPCRCPGVCAASDSGKYAVHAALPAPSARQEARAHDHAAEQRTASSPASAERAARRSRRRRPAAAPGRPRAPSAIGVTNEVDHRRAVHREQLVIAVARDDLHARLGELGAHQQGEDAARRRRSRSAVTNVRTATDLWSVPSAAARPRRGATGAGTAALTAPSRARAPPTRETRPARARRR